MVRWWMCRSDRVALRNAEIVSMVTRPGRAPARWCRWAQLEIPVYSEGREAGKEGALSTTTRGCLCLTCAAVD